MPISGDEIDYNRSQEAQSTMSKAELRKTHKPIMEKRRRARINHCLNEIKTLILEAMNKDPSRHTKLEKADILEMAVKHLQNVQRQQLAMAMASDPTVLRKFKTGFNECAAEIDKYMNQSDGVDNTMKLRVVNHLQKCIGGIEQVAQFSFGNFSNVSFVSGTSTGQITGSSSGDQNNNPRIQIPQGIQLIPSRLPSGELALLVPNSRNINFFPTNQRQSAFATVIPSSTADVPKPLSPPVSPLLNQDEPRIRIQSPHGFRPVVPTKHYNEDHQVPQISSTATQLSELKTLKYPINKKLESPKKIGEPLCIITNQGERYKQAQMKEESAHFEENIIRGVKREFPEPHGLLTVASDNVFYPPAPKVLKTHLLTQDCQPSSSFYDDDHKRMKQELPASKDHSDSTSDMWRPW